MQKTAVMLTVTAALHVWMKKGKNPPPQAVTAGFVLCAKV